jgi:hypothetical protein
MNVVNLSAAGYAAADVGRGYNHPLAERSRRGACKPEAAERVGWATASGHQRCMKLDNAVPRHCYRDDDLAVGALAFDGEA